MLFSLHGSKSQSRRLLRRPLRVLHRSVSVAYRSIHNDTLYLRFKKSTNLVTQLRWVFCFFLFDMKAILVSYMDCKNNPPYIAELQKKRHKKAQCLRVQIELVTFYPTLLSSFSVGFPMVQRWTLTLQKICVLNKIYTHKFILVKIFTHLYFET